MVALCWMEHSQNISYMMLHFETHFIAFLRFQVSYLELHSSTNIIKLLYY
jgi:hypothetical protein